MGERNRSIDKVSVCGAKMRGPFGEILRVRVCVCVAGEEAPQCRLLEAAELVQGAAAACGAAPLVSLDWQRPP